MHGHFFSFACYHQLPYFPEAKLSYPQLSPKDSKNLFTSLSPASPQIISTRNYSKTFSPAKLSYSQINNNPKPFKNFFGRQKCLSHKSTTTRKNSKSFSPAKLCEPQINNIPKIVKGFFACKIVLAANHQQPENIQRHFWLQNCFSRRSPKSRNFSNFPARSSNQQQQPAKVISSGNQQQQPAAATSSGDQHQWPARAINSSNQQQQSAAATSSSNQQQQPAAATSNAASSNQQKQPAATSYHPTSSTYATNADLR